MRMDRIGPRLLIGMGLNLVIPLLQVIGGIYAQSNALISDAVHNFSDFGALLIAYLAHIISQRGVTKRNTFGYKRAEVLGATINVGLLLAASGLIVYEGIERLNHPAPVLGNIVVYLAAIAILGNGFSALLLLEGSKESLNVKGAFLHMVGDMLTSVAVLFNGIILVFRPWYWMDPLLSFLIVAFILRNCWGITKEATFILMNATPTGLSLDAIKERLEAIEGVCSVHYLHAWKVSSDSIAFSCHVQVNDQMISNTEDTKNKIRSVLWQDFGIDHPVLQFETVKCGNGGLLCEMSPPREK